MFKSRTGLLLGAAGLLIAMSPEARRAIRKLAVKGTEAVLELTDQVKEAGASLQNRFASRPEQQELLPRIDLEKVRNPFGDK